MRFKIQKQIPLMLFQILKCSQANMIHTDNSRVNGGLNTVHAWQNHRLLLFTPKAKNAQSYDSCMTLNHPPGPSDETALSSIVSFRTGSVSASRAL